VNQRDSKNNTSSC